MNNNVIWIKCNIQIKIKDTFPLLHLMDLIYGEYLIWKLYMQFKKINVYMSKC